MMADGWLADRAALGEVARTHRSASGRQLTEDREADRVGDRLQELDVGVERLHPMSISMVVNIASRGSAGSYVQLVDDLVHALEVAKDAQDLVCDLERLDLASNPDGRPRCVDLDPVA